MGDRRITATAGAGPHLVAAGTHLCYLFDDEQERKRVLAAMVQQGLDGHYRVDYLADEETADMVPPARPQAWLTDDLVHAREQLHLHSAIDVHCPDGTFDADRMLAHVHATTDTAIAAGWSGTWILDEMTWALRSRPCATQLLAYEAALNTSLRAQPITMVCQYDVRRFDGSTLFDVLAVHPLMVVRGQVVDNPFYARPGAGSAGTARCVAETTTC